MKHLFLFTLFGLFILEACASKEPDEKPVSAVFTNITSGTWTQSLSFIDPENNGQFVPTGFSCDQDNWWTFKTDSTFVTTEGPVLCDPDEPYPAVTSKWYLENNDQDLVLEFEFDLIQYKIIAYSDTLLQLESEVVHPIDPNLSYSTRLILKR